MLARPLLRTLGRWWNWRKQYRHTAGPFQIFDHAVSSIPLIFVGMAGR
jgi:hypothetical protein